MDVQTLAPVAAQTFPADPSGGSSQPAPEPATISVAPISAQVVRAVPGDPSTPAPTLHLPHEIAKIFTGGASSHVTVSFQVEHNPNEIVTVFKNSATGEIISQVPSEIMIKMAEFFDQVAGVVLDRSV